MAITVLSAGLPLAVPAAPPPAEAEQEASESAGLDLVSLCDRAGAALADDGRVVAVVPDWAQDDVPRGLASVRSALDTNRVAVHVTELPPLAGALLTQLLSELAQLDSIRADDLVRAATLLERQITGMAWLGSVTNLKHPAPTVAMHARSLLPGTAFLAVVEEESTVAVLPKEGSVTVPPSRNGAARQVLLAAGDGDVDRVRSGLEVADAIARVVELSPTPISTEWWGTEKLVEVALGPDEVEPLVPLIEALRPSTSCPWCEARVEPGVCPFCHMQFSEARNTERLGGTR